MPSYDDLVTCPFCGYPVDPEDGSTTTVSFYACRACGEEWSVRWRGKEGTVLVAYPIGHELLQSSTVRRIN